MDAVEAAMLAAAPTDQIRAAVQGQLDYLASVPTNAAALKQWMGSAVQWAGANPGQRIIIGEFGVYKLHTSDSDRATWLHDVRKIAESLDWGWCVWEANKGFGLFDGDNIETLSLRALIDTPAPKTSASMPSPTASPVPQTSAVQSYCTLSLHWEQLVALRVQGKAVHTGGLGGQATAEMGVWLCVDASLANCTSTSSTLMAPGYPCFRYNERLFQFEWWGWNGDLSLV